MKLDKTYDQTVDLIRENTFDNEIIIVDGQGRSGKNLISVLLNISRHKDYPASVNADPPPQTNLPSPTLHRPRCPIQGLVER